MPSDPVKRQTHVTGDDFQTFNNGGNSPHSQGVTLCDATGRSLCY